MRECLRGGTAEAGFMPLALPFSIGEVGLWSSGAVWDAAILLPGGGIASCWAGKDEERGEGVMGEKGPDIERVRW